MADKHTVLQALSKLNVPHLVKAFETATTSATKNVNELWIDVGEMKQIVKTATTKGGQGLSTTEWRAILEIAKYDEVGPEAKKYITDLEKRWNDKVVQSKAKATGPAVTLAHAEKYNDVVLGMSPYKGECAAGVQDLFQKAGKSLGLTSAWKQGVKVRGSNVAPGTAIASFKNGKYWHHAAIFIRETKAGLEVWDQWAGQPWHKRTLYFNDKDTTDGSNNGNLFYVINK